MLPVSDDRTTFLKLRYPGYIDYSCPVNVIVQPSYHKSPEHNLTIRYWNDDFLIIFNIILVLRKQSMVIIQVFTESG